MLEIGRPHRKDEGKNSFYNVSSRYVKKNAFFFFFFGAVVLLPQKIKKVCPQVRGNKEF